MSGFAGGEETWRGSDGKLSKDHSTRELEIEAADSRIACGPEELMVSASWNLVDHTVRACRRSEGNGSRRIQTRRC